MRIIDWSSDVCSSDLARVVAAVNALRLPHQFVEWQVEQFRDFLARPVGAGVRHPIASSACARSAMMSSICSIPPDTRTTSGPAPVSTSYASDNWLLVVARSEERRVGNDGVSMVISRRYHVHSKTKT